MQVSFIATLRRVSFLVIVGSTTALFALGCANNDTDANAPVQEPSAAGSAKSSTPAGDPGKTNAISSNIPAVVLTRDQFLTMFSDREMKKLVLVLRHNGNRLLLTIYPAKNNSKEFDVRNRREAEFLSDMLEVSGKNIQLGDQQTKKGDFEALHKAITADATLMYVIFEPLEREGRLRYKIYGNQTRSTKSLTSPLVLAIESDPSPPASADVD